MTTIWGLDVATTTGWAAIVPAEPPRQWRCLAIESEGENGEEKAGDLAIEIHRALARARPDFVAMEMPQRSVKAFGKKTVDAAGREVVKETINPNALQLSALAGAVVGVLDVAGIPWGLIAPATWRAAYYGGMKPKDGDWKALAVAMADHHEILLPSLKKARSDAAEAVGIAVAWRKCSFIPKRHQAAFMALCMGRSA